MWNWFYHFVERERGAWRTTKVPRKLQLWWDWEVLFSRHSLGNSSDISAGSFLYHFPVICKLGKSAYLRSNNCFCGFNMSSHLSFHLRFQNIEYVIFKSVNICGWGTYEIVMQWLSFWRELRSFALHQWNFGTALKDKYTNTTWKMFEDMSRRK